MTIHGIVKEERFKKPVGRVLDDDEKVRFDDLVFEKYTDDGRINLLDYGTTWHGTTVKSHGILHDGVFITTRPSLNEMYNLKLRFPDMGDATKE